MRATAMWLALALALAGCDCGRDEAGAPAVDPAATPPSTDPYVLRLASLCEQGSTRHCWYLGALYSLGGADLEADPARAAALFEQSCGDQGVQGCREAGMAREAAGDLEGAHARWERGCRALRVRSCAELLKRQEAREIPFEESTVLGCRAGVDHFCHAAGTAVADIDPTPEGQPSEESLLPRGVDRIVMFEAKRCDRRTGTLCTALAERYLADPPPRGMTRDPEHARRLAERSCNAMNVTGCAVLGRLALEADPPDRALGEQLLTRACDGGSMRGCRYIVQLLDPLDSEEEQRRRDLQLELCLTFEEPRECDPIRDLVGPDYGATAPGSPAP